MGGIVSSRWGVYAPEFKSSHRLDRSPIEMVLSDAGILAERKARARRIVDLRNERATLRSVERTSQIGSDQSVGGLAKGVVCGYRWAPYPSMASMASDLSYNATLAAKHVQSDHAGIFQVAPDSIVDGDAPWFVPGQYLTLGINPGGKQEPVRRPMTIVSSTVQRRVVEFYLNRVSNPRSETPLTHLLWMLSPGDRLYMRTHPAGRFTIADTVGQDDNRLRICIGQGTGIAPFVSMIRSCDEKKDFVGRYALIHGVERQEFLTFHDEMVRFQQNAGLHYFPIVETPWSGIQGRACDFVGEPQIDLLEKELGLGVGELCPNNAVIFVCGLQPEILATIKPLLARGFVPQHRKIRRALAVPAADPSSLFFEQYDNTRIFNVEDPGALKQLRAKFRSRAL